MRTRCGRNFQVDRAGKCSGNRVIGGLFRLKHEQRRKPFCGNGDLEFSRASIHRRSRSDAGILPLTAAFASPIPLCNVSCSACLAAMRAVRCVSRCRASLPAASRIAAASCFARSTIVRASASASDRLLHRGRVPGSSNLAVQFLQCCFGLPNTAPQHLQPPWASSAPRSSSWRFLRRSQSLCRRRKNSPSPRLALKNSCSA